MLRIIQVSSNYRIPSELEKANLRRRKADIITTLNYVGTRRETLKLLAELANIEQRLSETLISDHYNPVDGGKTIGIRQD